MYDKEAGVVACDSCDLTIDGMGSPLVRAMMSPAAATAGNVPVRS